MFKVHVNDGINQMPEDDICYIVAKEGIFLKKKTGIMESIAPVQNISILDSIQSMARMNIKKIPGGQFARVIAFFKEVYKKYYGEAIVLLFYDEVKNVYKIVPPRQKVTGGSCDYNKGISIEGMQMIGTIHSHASMSAFHSGIDDTDEEHFDGLHITIGNMRDEEVSITASIVANGSRFVIDPLDYVERLELTKDVDEVVQHPTRRVFKWVHGKMVESTSTAGVSTYGVRKYDKRYKVNVSSKYHRVISSWMNMVEKGTPTYKRYSGVWSQGKTNNKWGGNYDASVWNQYKNASGKTPSAFSPPTKPVEFPPHDIDIEGNEFPCQTCVFRAHKFLAEQQEDIDDEPDVYLCENCGETIVDNTASPLLATCPKCKTDEYLVLLTEEDLPNNYVNSDDVSHLQKEPGVKEDSLFVTCQNCLSQYYMLEGDTVCPFCQMDNEDLVTAQSRMDSGAYIEPTTEEINQAAIEEAKLADETIERIPDPNEQAIPITEKPKGVKRIGDVIKRFRGGGK